MLAIVLMLGLAIGGPVMLVALAMCVALRWSLNLNKLFVPTPQDESMRLEAAGTTKTANYNGAAWTWGRALGLEELACRWRR
jgi:hypothetical protein